MGKVNDYISKNVKIYKKTRLVKIKKNHGSNIIQELLKV